MTKDSSQLELLFNNEQAKTNDTTSKTRGPKKNTPKPASTGAAKRKAAPSKKKDAEDLASDVNPESHTPETHSSEANSLADSSSELSNPEALPVLLPVEAANESPNSKSESKSEPLKKTPPPKRGTKKVSSKNSLEDPENNPPAFEPLSLLAEDSVKAEVKEPKKAKAVKKINKKSKQAKDEVADEVAELLNTETQAFKPKSLLTLAKPAVAETQTSHLASTLPSEESFQNSVELDPHTAAISKARDSLRASLNVIKKATQATNNNSSSNNIESNQISGDNSLKSSSLPLLSDFQSQNTITESPLISELHSQDNLDTNSHNAPYDGDDEATQPAQVVLDDVSSSFSEAGSVRAMKARKSFAKPRRKTNASQWIDDAYDGGYGEADDISGDDLGIDGLGIDDSKFTDSIKWETQSFSTATNVVDTEPEFVAGDVVQNKIAINSLLKSSLDRKIQGKNSFRRDEIAALPITDDLNDDEQDDQGLALDNTIISLEELSSEPEKAPFDSSYLENNDLEDDFDDDFDDDDLDDDPEDDRDDDLSNDLDNDDDEQEEHFASELDSDEDEDADFDSEEEQDLDFKEDRKEALPDSRAKYAKIAAPKLAVVKNLRPNNDKRNSSDLNKRKNSEANPEANPEARLEAELKRGKRKMFVSVLPEEEVEVVLCEDGQVIEYYVEMLHQAKTKGNIYKAVINNIDANLQAAFVSYGAVKNGFLQIDEVHPEYFLAHHEPSRGRKFPPIQKVLKPGQEILVQVVKEPTGNKGAFLTSYLSIPGRFLVLTPGREQIGVSRKVDEDGERSRLRGLLEGLNPGPGLGVIVRTVSMGASKASLHSDLQFLKRLWKDVRNNGSEETSPCLIYQEPDLASRAVRDYLTEEVCEIWVDDEPTSEHIRGMADLLYPNQSGLVKLHKDYNQSLWDRFNIQKQLDQIQSREVVLPSGGRLVFDQTEALMAIDINTAKATGKSNFESTVLRTNMEAAEIIPMQLKLRDVGGQIVIDFIEMREQSHWRSVERTLRDAMKTDRARHDVGKISRFGLMEIVRQRLASSAISVSSETCPHCAGTGTRRNLEWQALKVMRDINRQLRKAQANNQYRLAYQLEAELALYLLNHKRERLLDLEKTYRVILELQPLPINIV